jgi:DUF4097 and DUF4098 domain-containing protein YvlB
MRQATQHPVLAVLLAASACTAMPGAAAQSSQITERVTRTVTLDRDADVEIRGINGTVTIETASGLRAAEVRVDIRASSREVLERRPILIESTSDTLTIRTEKNKGNSDREWVRHDVFVRMPREVSLDIGGVNGQVNVQEIDGEIGLNGINGRTTVRLAGTASRISGINGRTMVSVSRLSDRGLRVDAVNGGIELGLPRDVNASLEVRGVNGGIDTDLPMTVTGRQRNGRLSGRLGNGGPPLTISAVNGGVTISAAR